MHPPLIACWRSRRAVIALFAIASTSMPPSAAAAEPLSFADAIRIGATSAPTVVAAERRAAALDAAALAAGELPDPALNVAIDNLPIDGADAFSVGRDFMTMRRIGIAQALPSRSRLAALRDVAEGEATVARVDGHRAALAAVREVSAGWLERRGIEAQRALLDALDRENELLAAAVRARYAAGMGDASSLTLPRAEALALADLRDDLGARHRKAMARLRRWLGGDAERPLDAEPPVAEAHAARLRTAVSMHPDLRELDARARLAESRIAEARAARNPDWSVSLGYQQRGPAYSDMISLQVTVDLRVFPSARQQPLIDARRRELEALAADRDARLAEHMERVEAALADIDRLDRLCKRQRDVAVPLAREREALAASGWRAGLGSLADWVTARRGTLESRLKAIELDTAWRIATHDVHLTYAQDAEVAP